MLRVENRRRKQVLPGNASEALVRFAPSFHSAGDGYTVNALLRHRSDALLLEKINGQTTGRPAAGIQSVELVAFGLPINKEEIATNAVHHRLGDAKYCIGGNGSVN